jgi:hypothetical protein
MTDDIPIDIIPITVYQAGEYVKIDGKGKNANTMAKTTRMDWFNTTKDKIEGNIQELVQSMIDNEILIMSDGSSKEGRSTAAWIISTKTAYHNGQYIYVMGEVPEKDSDSHRAEGFGVLGGLLSWIKYKKLWEIDNQQSIKVMCDNASILQEAGNLLRHKYITGKYRDYDVLMSIRTIAGSGKYIYKHIKGHQDKDDIPTDIEAMMNCHAHKLARNAYEAISQPAGFYN